MPAWGKDAILKCCSHPAGGGVFGSWETPVVDSGVRTSPSISSGEIPASAMAFRIAMMVMAPMLVSGFSSQRRAVGDVSMPVATTLPRPSQSPMPSLFRNQLRGTPGCGIVYPCFAFPSCLPCQRGLAYHPPFGHLLARRGGRFKDHLDRSPDRYLIHGSPGEMGQHDHLGLFIQRDCCDVEGLLRNQRGGRGVMHHHTADDPATAAQLPPLHRGIVPTTGTRWLRRELIPKAIGAILDYEPLLVASVVEGLVQRIGYGGLFGHIFRPFRFQSKTARACLLVDTSPEAHRVSPSDVCRQRW